MLKEVIRAGMVSMPRLNRSMLGCWVKFQIVKS
jgi:hypothetical protein